MTHVPEQPMTPPRLWRQGDILLQETSPRELSTLKRLSKPVLAEGERTGHRHAVKPANAARLYLSLNELGPLSSFMRGPLMLLEICKDTATVVHPEHGPIELPRGWYKVWRQREFGSSNTSRWVAD